MKIKFFDYTLTENHILGFGERIIPIIILFAILAVIYFLRDSIEAETSIDKAIRFITFAVIAFFFMVPTMLRWIDNGISRYTLPLHFCNIAEVMSCILLITKNEHIYKFLASSCVPTSFAALVVPSLKMPFYHVEYYHFVICHMGVSLATAYFAAIYGYRVDKKEYSKMIFIAICSGLIMGIFNEIMGTSYFFVAYTRNAGDGSILERLGAGSEYILSFLGIILIGYAVWYIIKVKIDMILER